MQTLIYGLLYDLSFRNMLLNWISFNMEKAIRIIQIETTTEIVKIN